MLNNDACVGRSPLTSEVLKDRVMVISLMVGCRRTRAETGIVRTEKGSVRLVMLMINYASVERLGQRQRQSWICDTERNNCHLYVPEHTPQTCKCGPRKPKRLMKVKEEPWSPTPFNWDHEGYYEIEGYNDGNLNREN